ncbi:putative type III restriction-modification system methylation subunit [Escherichia coli]|nr:putative type III restriction-modification system methylation subunit [Escherichia coli]
MEKLKMHSPNLTQDNIARIRDLVSRLRHRS